MKRRWPITRVERLRRNRRQRAEIARYFRDCRSWNEAHPKYFAIDPDPDGEMLRCLSLLEQAEAELCQ